jgi:hypothetical protein
MHTVEGACPAGDSLQARRNPITDPSPDPSSRSLTLTLPLTLTLTLTLEPYP